MTKTTLEQKCAFHCPKCKYKLEIHGEKRLSIENTKPVQSNYALIIFLNKLFKKC